MTTKCLTLFMKEGTALVWLNVGELLTS